MKIKFVNQRLEDEFYTNYDYDYFHAVVWIQDLDCVYLKSKADRSWIFSVTTKMAVLNKVQSLRGRENDLGAKECGLYYQPC